MDDYGHKLTTIVCENIPRSETELFLIVFFWILPCWDTQRRKQLAMVGEGSQGPQPSARPQSGSAINPSVYTRDFYFRPILIFEISYDERNCFGIWVWAWTLWISQNRKSQNVKICWGMISVEESMRDCDEAVRWNAVKLYAVIMWTWREVVKMMFCSNWFKPNEKNNLIVIHFLFSWNQQHCVRQKSAVRSHIYNT